MKAQFTDAQAMAKSNPLTFKAPSQADLDSIKRGDFVKVAANNVERFWVEVTQISGSKIGGVVNNDLVRTHIHGLQCGDLIQFEKRHIYQVLD